MNAFYDLYVAADKRRSEFAEAIGSARGSMQLALDAIEAGKVEAAKHLLEQGVADTKTLFAPKPAQREEQAA